ncbi:glycosyltransferase family 2 protein [Algisphaera agarilytica]|uniref:(Heptosyl)LPS beta-1,4-glucosyltransferase n=1 Tax=Algisphaera agarilytica TaxID=1385975 RepID=A0A7X0LMD4_9BACT|nr:glycosyltransferase family 2 protein [Algisphaera agarilytica]MBB6430908.1 (heptosyl)LPS beta-1,4-glucosyltransferase [Algisphaera agarilytica]
MAKISVVICCANAEATLPAAVASVKWADELVIVDSGSEDRTAEIAQAAADVYRLEPWRGYTGQKKFGTELAANDWVLVLDGDEEVSPKLAQQIQALTDGELDGLDVVYCNRRNWVMGRPVRAWWPDRQSRLIHRGRTHWPEEALHDTREPSDPSRTKRLSGHLEHKRVGFDGLESWSDYFSGKRLDERVLMVARQMHAQGKRASWASLALRPYMAFIKFYFIKRGFLDGTFGLLIAQKAAFSVQLKYAALWAVQQEEAGGPKAAEADPPANAGRQAD